MLYLCCEKMKKYHKSFGNNKDYEKNIYEKKIKDSFNIMLDFLDIVNRWRDEADILTTKDFLLVDYQKRLTNQLPLYCFSHITDEWAEIRQDVYSWKNRKNNANDIEWDIEG